MATAAFDDRPREPFQWKRSSAISVTLAAHALAALLILAPPAMEPVEKRDSTAVEPIVLIPEKKPEEIQPVPILPQPRRFEPRPPRPVPRAETPPAPPMPMEANDSPMAIPTDPAPPAPDPGPATIPDTAPTALGYGAGDRRIAYPRDAIKNRQEGTVMLRVKIGVDGVPLEAQVERSSGVSSLDRAAREAVMKWRFTPGTRNGQPFIAWGLVPISFKLNEL